MQGLQNYAGNSSPELSPTLPSNGSSSTMNRPNAIASSSTAPQPRMPSPKVRPSKVSASPTPTASSSKRTSQPQSVNAHTPAQEVAGAQPEESRSGKYDGLSDDQILRIITKPADCGLEDWGIPPAVPSEMADDRLKAKVAKFLDMKYNENQHINSTLLSSTAFANPHIYAKLVDFVAIAETASAFPSGGWLTRQGLEAKRGPWGPSAISESQRQEAQAIKASQERGARTEVAFKKARKDRDRERDKPYRR